MNGLTIALTFCDRPVMPEWAVAFACQSYPSGISREVIVAKNLGLSQDWLEKVVTSARKKNSKYIWLLHDDVEPPFFATRKLIYDLEQNDQVMVAAGIYCLKGLPTEPFVYRGDGEGAFWHWKVGDVFECDAIGDGCMMIKTEIFDKIEKPWFHFEKSRMQGNDTIGDVGEDFFFCRKVRAAGFKILADGEVVCPHWDVENKCAYGLPRDSYPLAKEQELVESE